MKLKNLGYATMNVTVKGLVLHSILKSLPFKGTKKHKARQRAFYEIIDPFDLMTKEQKYRAYKLAKAFSENKKAEK